MSLTEKQISLVKESWAKVTPIADTAAEIFYAKLFELDPNLKNLFKSDMKEQGKKLMTMISVAVESLDKLDTIVTAIQEMGVRHKGYGVEESHYGTVAEALLYTLGKGLGDEFTDEVKDAWVEVYTILSTVMIEAAK
jgi:hemoglobin-like flavoprotein